MKSKKLILGLAMAITMGLGVTAYAANTETTTSPASVTATHQRIGLGKVAGIKGYDYVEAVLKNKLGMTAEEITTGFNAGKTIYDLAKEKGMTEDEFKQALLEERNKAIDKSVADGTITKEEGDSMKETLENNIDSCAGIPGQGRWQSETSYSHGSGKNCGGKDTGKGHMPGAGSKGLANCYLNDTSN